MSRKNKDIPTGPPESGPSVLEDPGYTVGDWSGLPLYECSHCHYSTTDLALIKQHVVQHLPPVKKTIKVPSGSGIVDAAGKPVMVEMEVETAPLPEEVPTVSEPEAKEEGSDK